MANKTYKIRPIEERDGRVKNIAIIVLSVLLLFSVICIFSSVNVSYTPAYNAVRENAELKQKISELEEEIDALNIQLRDASVRDSKETVEIVPPNQHVDGYDEYRRNTEDLSE